jgi:hypothetical protein
VSDVDTLIPIRPELTPDKAPNAATLAAARALADKISTSAPPYALALTSYVEGMVRALRSGDLAAFVVGLQAIEATAGRLVASFDGWRDIESLMRSLDPAYWEALAPSRSEFLTLRAMAEMDPMTNSQLRDGFALHTALCPNAKTCSAHEAFRRVFEARGIRI